MLRKFISIAIIAVIPFVTGCDESTGRRARPNIPFRLPVINEKPKSFESCTALQEWRDRKWFGWYEATTAYNDWAREVNSGEPLSSTTGSSNAAALPSSSSNIQEPGVDEPDLAKTDGKRIFYVRKTSEYPSDIYMIEIIHSDTLEPTQSIKIESRLRPLIFVWKGELAVVVRSYSDTKISFYRQKHGLHELKKTFVTDGRYVDARLLNDEIFLVAQRWVGGAQFDVSKMSIPCDRILESAIDDFSFDLTEVHKISFGDSSVESVGRLGRMDQMYMTSEHLYLFSKGYTWFDWDTRLSDDRVFGTSTVTRFNAEKLKADAGGTAFIDGGVRNQFSFGESASGDSLFVATTGSGSGNSQSSRLWTLQDDDGQFATVSRTEEFGLGETIRSVRFIGERAYVVTFRTTDPLFTFDIRDPLKVRLMSHLEIPGFSAYLHPSMTGELFGAGYQADSMGQPLGLQFSLFDPQADGGMKVRDRLEIGSRYSHVDVGRDHHAFFHLKEKNVAALPMRIVGETGAMEFAGALALDLEDGISIAAKWTHRDLTPPECKVQPYTWWSWANESHDIQRVVEVPCGVVTLSPFGAKLHRSSAPWDDLVVRKFSGTNVGSQGCLNTY